MIEIKNPYILPHDYKKPETADEILQRYNKGERYFCGSVLRNKNIKGESLNGSNLSDADLSGSDFSNSSLKHVRLSKADMNDTNFRKADLHSIIAPRAIFSGASMQNCVLTKANLFESSLDGANLSGAKLQEANLSRSSIENTIFGNASFGATILGDMDFSCATFDKVRVVGRNLIGSITIDKTAKGIRKILEKEKKCNSECLIDSNPASGIYSVLKVGGQPDEFINLYKKLSGFNDYYSCFISYSHANYLFAKLLEYKLQAVDIDYFLDSKNMKHGDKLLTIINENIKKFERYIFCSSKDSLNSPWVQKELEIILNKEINQNTTESNLGTIITIDLDGYINECNFDFVNELKARKMIKLINWKSEEANIDFHFREVIDSLKRPTP